MGSILKLHWLKKYNKTHQTIVLCSNVLYFGGTKIIRQHGDIHGRRKMILGMKNKELRIELYTAKRDICLLGNIMNNQCIHNKL